ncbi:DNA polymerase IV [Pelagicoccus enzymogenes]|uniref:DNA polymerase IV n=1 Tax=Pelagicoccus enzymogenes TaxID=2773457 RepID=UPI00280EB3F4|nr:DNA polymerase IV [Pelagicoccus enzymogenes]MDQ8197106.1 DNA polymerase IV [Pelagicoccus enzymogenes]
MLANPRPFSQSHFTISPRRQIIHIDMDCFYAAIEVRDRPELRREPVAVGGHSNRRGVLTTCNYEARAFGCHSAMPTFQALQRCPHLVVLPVRFDVYRNESRRIRRIFRDYTELIEPLSLDEAYLDVSHHTRPAASIAQEIRSRIRQTTGLNASAGIAPNKMLAKIASDWRKPNGQYEVKSSDIGSFMQSLPVSKIWGVGKKAVARLAEHDLHTCGDLQKQSRLELQQLFGKFGSELYELCRGIDYREVVSNRIRKSMSCERTYSKDLDSLEDRQQHAADIFQELSHDLARFKSDRPISKLFVKCKYSDFTRSSIERSGLPFQLSSFQDLLDESYERRSDPIRLLGLGVRFLDPEAQMRATQQLEFDLG